MAEGEEGKKNCAYGWDRVKGRKGRRERVDMGWVRIRIKKGLRK